MLLPAWMLPRSQLQFNLALRFCWMSSSPKPPRRTPSGSAPRPGGVTGASSSAIAPVAPTVLTGREGRGYCDDAGADDDPDADEGDLLLRDSDAGSTADSRVPTPLPGEGFSFTRSRPTSPLGREREHQHTGTTPSKRSRVLKLAVGVVLGIGIAWVSAAHPVTTTSVAHAPPPCTPPTLA